MSDSFSEEFMSVRGNSATSSRHDEVHEDVIEDEFSTFKEVSEAMRTQGLESCHMIFGIDYTISNNRTGELTFGGKSLHSIQENTLNPYQKVICVFGETLEPFNRGEDIPVLGFGDSRCKDKTIFELKQGEQLNNASDVLKAYNEATPGIKLGGPTQFAPLIYWATDKVRECNKYHILIIVTDGQIPDEEPTKKAIIEASEHPLSIVTIGVGDGPWKTMKEFDDGLRGRKFDNFQFVNFNEVMKDEDNPEASFALHSLMEIPKQYEYLKQNGLV